MPIRKKLVQETLRDWLAPLHSFLRNGHDWADETRENPLDKFQDFISAEAALEPGESILGVYFNSSQHLDCLVVTDYGIRSIDQNRQQFLSYDAIESIEEPCATDRDLDIVLKTGEYTSIAVLSATDGSPDIFAFYDYLSCLLSLRHQSLTEIEDIKSLPNFLRYIHEYDLDEMAAWIENDLVDYSTAKLKVDPGIFKHPDIWRLLALVSLAQPWQTSDDR